MCGLLGLYAKKDSALTPEIAGLVLSQLALRNEARGGDSFGMGVVLPESKTTKLYKTVGRISSPGNLRGDWGAGISEVMRAINDNKNVVVIGHNRKATTGANTVRNAHPFICGKLDRGDFVIGAHNGVIGPWKDVKSLWKIQKNMEVDSEIIFRGMQKFHTEDKRDLRILGELHPIATISATYMLDMNTISLYRGDNPLSVFIGDGFIFWSSLDTHLQDSTFGLAGERKDLSARTVLRVDVNNMKLSTDSVQPSDALRDSLFPSRIHGFLPGTKGKGLVVGDKRSSTQEQRDEARIARLFGADTTLSDDLELSDDEDNEMVTPLYSKKKVQDLFPKHYVVVPKTANNMRECCVCEHQGEPKGTPTLYEPWELLWYGGDALCPTCYYYLVQYDKEQRAVNTFGSHD